ncbi:MAG: YlqD family protein, partial [Pseudomonadota bacterium]|nr:YlqD family protein [Pseudomonadota bacterium]
MKTTIERSAFLKALNHVQSVVERRNTIPILSNVLLEAENGVVTLTATDLEIEVRERVEAEIAQRNVNMEEFKGRTSEIEALTLGSEFVQGTVDGFVNVSVGDNLY